MIGSPGWRDYVKLVEELKAKSRSEVAEGKLSAEAALAVNDYFDRALGIIEMVIADSDAQLDRAEWENEVIAERVDLEHHDHNRPL